MVRDGLDRGALRPGKTIRGDFGNTGIGLAMVGAALGFPVKLAMPECVSFERRRTLEAFGAELVLTEGCLGTDGAIRMAERIYEADPETYFLPDQFKNPANTLAHYRHTGREIWSQTGGVVDAFVAGLGTTGTVMGVGRRLKEHHPAVRIVAVEPTVGHKIQGLKNMQESIVPAIYDREARRQITVKDEAAFEMTRRLAQREACSSGCPAAPQSSRRSVARDIDTGTVVVLICDRPATANLSTNLFTSICAQCRRSRPLKKGGNVHILTELLAKSVRAPTTAACSAARWIWSPTPRRSIPPSSASWCVAVAARRFTCPGRRSRRWSGTRSSCGGRPRLPAPPSRPKARSTPAGTCSTARSSTRSAPAWCGSTTCTCCAWRTGCA
jgi:cysteine synthase B